MEMIAQTGHDPHGFYVRESHRHPKYNLLRGGAVKSQHIWGTAADLVAEDINRDGKTDQLDKEILLSAAQQVVNNRGGVGLYPGTLTVHADVRGYRARW